MKGISWDLFKAMKFQVTEFQHDCGMNLAEMFATVKAGDRFWRNQCIGDYEHEEDLKRELGFWIVERARNMYDDMSGRLEIVAVVSDRAIAKAIARRERRKGYIAYACSEPTRWV